MTDPEAFLRRFHAARPGITSTALARTSSSYDRLVAAVPGGARVLDLGCGDDHLVARFGRRAVGIDLAPSRGSGARSIVAARAQQLPFADRSFDAAVSHLAFMLFDDLEQVVAELRRVVVPGGAFAAVLGGGPTADGDDAFHRFLALADRERALRGAGFGDRRARTEAGWQALFGGAPDRSGIAPRCRFERFEIDLSGSFDDVWRFLGASYQLVEAEAPAIRDRLRGSYAAHAIVPCRVVMWLATVGL